MKNILNKIIKIFENLVEPLRLELENDIEATEITQHVGCKTDYCQCSQISLMKPISETEYERFDCGKEIKQ